MKPVKPAFGLPPRPVAPSSRISPPEPVAAPANGAIAVGGCEFPLSSGCERPGSCIYKRIDRYLLSWVETLRIKTNNHRCIVFIS